MQRPRHRQSWTLHFHAPRIGLEEQVASQLDFMRAENDSVNAITQMTTGQLNQLPEHHDSLSILARPCPGLFRRALTRWSSHIDSPTSYVHDSGNRLWAMQPGRSSKIARDITSPRETGHRIRMLMREVNHRVKSVFDHHFDPRDQQAGRKPGRIGSALCHTFMPLLVRLTWPLAVPKIFGPAAVSTVSASAMKELASRSSQLRSTSAESGLLVPSALLRSSYKEVSVPAGILAGDGDRLLDAKGQAHRLHADVPGSLIHIVQNSGHMVHHSASQAVLAMIHTVVATAGANDEALRRTHD
ncbi:hypothetical protein NKJ09_31910 [Mesorhizobium sp. M0189]|uniref:alpha/beta fold hydrolase n=1 Tax=unclassified Mesorhizobium TaxID=325217 RepID=UPI003334B830